MQCPGPLQKYCSDNKADVVRRQNTDLGTLFLGCSSGSYFFSHLTFPLSQIFKSSPIILYCLQFAFHSSPSVYSTPVTPIFLCFTLSFTPCVCWENTGNASRSNVTAATFTESERALSQPVFHKSPGSGGAQGSPALALPWAQLELGLPGRDWLLFHAECFLQCRHCSEPQGARTRLKSASSPVQTGSFLAFRNFTHPSLPCLVFPFCSHYLFIRMRQTPSQTRWNPVLGSISSCCRPTPASPRAPAIPPGWRTSPNTPRQ